MYQILQKCDVHWHGGSSSIAMVYHLRRVSDLLYDWKSFLLYYMKDVVLHCSTFFKWNDSSSSSSRVITPLLCQNDAVTLVFFYIVTHAFRCFNLYTSDWLTMINPLRILRIYLRHPQKQCSMNTLFMMTSSNGNISRVTGHLCGEYTGHRWIPHTKASDPEHWCFLSSASE